MAERLGPVAEHQGFASEVLQGEPLQPEDAGDLHSPSMVACGCSFLGLSGMFSSRLKMLLVQFITVFIQVTYSCLETGTGRVAH